MTKDMTQGAPMKTILGFAVPLLFGYLFQQFYNLVDTVIVGQVLGKEALAAVGATGSVNFLIIGFCVGICSGFSIPVSHKFGAGDYSGLRRYVANCIWLSIGFAAVLTVFTTCFCRQILELMNTPDDIIGGAYSYIWVIFAGIPFIILYNMVSGVIRALGDSRTPLFFLVLSSVLNIGLDLLFIIRFGSGVEGAAWATVTSQAVSGVGCLIFMAAKFDILRIRGDEWRPNVHMMGVLCGMGVPMGLQYSITAIGSVILQTATNGLGSDAVAAVTAGGKISGFLVCPFDALGSTMATYGGQNVGAGRLERLGQGMRSAILVAAGYCVLALFVALLGGGKLALLFLDSSETGIIANVQTFLLYNTSCYFLLALVNIVRFMIQGMGFPTFAILSGVFEMIARALTGICLVPILGYVGVCLGNPIAWLLADLFLIPAYFHERKKLERMKQKS